MFHIRTLILCATLAFSEFALIPAHAGETDPLFVNATTDQPHRTTMALVFSKNQLARKHPVTVFLNDRGVLVASKPNSETFKEQQELLKGLIDAGATVIACPICMEHYGVKEADLLPGVKKANPELISQTLFADNVKTMSW
jgi:sulfur relay (sulfurtransferase) complex TusBCD TusD component (DsrE family)